MAILRIRTYPEEVLKKKAATVEEVDDEVRHLMDDMTETMYAAPGIGLAAPQVGVSRRIIVVDVSTTEKGQGQPLLQLANPEIIASSGEAEIEEGCLSLPEFTTQVKRAAEVTVKAIDRDGNPVTVEANGILAIALQHEIDHINGTIILDYARGLKREFYKKKVRKQLAKAS
jgi:peptide deformylase